MSDEITRRELLNYLLAGSIGVTGASLAGLFLWSQRGTYEPGNPDTLFSFSDIVDINVNAPTFIRGANVYLALINGGLIALDGRCPFRQFVVRWVAVNNRFECPWCGSKFSIAGEYSWGASPRNLDHVEMTVFTDDETYRAIALGDVINVDIASINEIWVDSARVIRGAPRET